jgi:hypothetical protein
MSLLLQALGEVTKSVINTLSPWKMGKPLPIEADESPAVNSMGDFGDSPKQENTTPDKPASSKKRRLSKSPSAPAEKKAKKSSPVPKAKAAAKARAPRKSVARAPKVKSESTRRSSTRGCKQKAGFYSQNNLERVAWKGDGSSTAPIEL